MKGYPMNLPISFALAAAAGAAARHRAPLRKVLDADCFQRAVQEAAARCGAGAGGFAVLLVSLERWPAVAGAHGRAGSERLLAEVQQRLRQAVGRRGQVGWLHTAQFAVLAETACGGTQRAFGQQLHALLCRPYLVDGDETVLRVAAGLGSFPGDGATADAVFDAAATALQYRQQLDGQGLACFEPQLGQAVRRQAELERALRKALGRGEFVLEYQPRVQAGSMRIVAAEALLRWDHPQLGRIAPLEFVAQAEAQGLIGAIGRWVLDSACQFASGLRQAGRPLRVSVNLSARQLEDDRIVDDVAQALARAQLPPQLLELELTESVLVEDRERCAALLHRLKALGVLLSVDDFGTGYSSLAYLQLFPVDAIKLDKTFVNREGGPVTGMKLVKALIDLAHALDLEVVAEGVEGPEVLLFLQANGCDEIQGYLVAPPLPAPQLRQFLAQHGAAWTPPHRCRNC
jgi:EAL domain-containing protein (putative c-di-GMP-specific phosphodiesterase class I)/GGDEF domain-containing protein